jgi:hypothetical protein
MACTDCQNPVKITPENVLAYSTTLRTVVGKDGRSHPVAQNHISPKVRPLSGWSAAFIINGQDIRIEGKTPQETYSSALEQLRLNGVEVTAENLWLNLNIQWMGRINDKHQIVRLSDLLHISQAGGSATHAPTRARKPVSPDVWGSKGWAMLQQYLAQDTYEYGRFLMLATELARWVDPSVNPTLGCADCFRHYTMALNVLRTNPLHTQDEARKWLFNLLNNVNVRKGTTPLTYAEAAERNFWL